MAAPSGGGGSLLSADAFVRISETAGSRADVGLELAIAALPGETKTAGDTASQKMIPRDKTLRNIIILPSENAG